FRSVTVFGYMLALVRFQLPHRVGNISPSHDCVSFKNTACLPSSDSLNDPLRDPGSAEIACGSTSEVMEQQIWNFSYFANCRPCGAKVSNWLSVVPREYVGRFLFATDASAQQRVHGSRHYNLSSLSVLCCSGL